MLSTVEPITRAIAFVANEIDEALNHPEKDYEGTFKDADADKNGEFVRKQDAPVIQDAEALGIGKPESHELTWNLSPLREDESVRADDL